MVQGRGLGISGAAGAGAKHVARNKLGSFCASCRGGGGGGRGGGRGGGVKGDKTRFLKGKKRNCCG